jgi:hypothetical protein
MARKPRLHVPGGLYHVMLRGNGGQDIFSDDEDRYRQYLLIQQGDGTIWPSGLRFLLHDEPHTLGCPGRGRSLVRDNAESVILLHPLNEIMTYVSAEYGVEEEELRGPSRNVNGGVKMYQNRRIKNVAIKRVSSS